MRLWDIEGEAAKEEDITDLDEIGSKEVVINLTGGVRDDRRRQRGEYKNGKPDRKQDYHGRQVARFVKENA